MHPEQTVDNRHRPLPLEPFASRESYVAAPNAGGASGVGVGVGGHYQQSQQQQQQEYQSTGQGGIQLQQQSRQQQLPSASASAAAEHKRNQEFNEHLRKSLTGEGQRVGNSNNSNNNEANLGVVGGKLLLPGTGTSPGGLISTDGKGGLLTSSSSGLSILNGNGNGISSISTTGGRPYPPILPWTEDIEESIGATISIPKIQSSPPPQAQGASGTGSGKGQKVRRKWTDQETKDLLTGCSIVSDSFVCVDGEG